MSPNILSLAATNRDGNPTPFTFTAKKDDDFSELPTKDPTDPLFEIPDNATSVRVTFKPTWSSPIVWGGAFSLSVAANGSLSVAAPSSADDEDFRNRVELRTMPALSGRLTLAVVKVSQFRDRTAHILDLLKTPPDKRCIWHAKEIDPNPPHKRGVFKMDAVDEVTKHTGVYGAWPPHDWNLYGVAAAGFLDVDAPLTADKALNFLPSLQDSSALDIDCVVLERAGVRMEPAYFAVAWPRSVTRNAKPAAFLLFIRQLLEGNHYDQHGLYVNSPGCLPAVGQLGPYPENFDYADSMFESLHYASVPLRFPDSKGVPYQANEAGADVVSVIPCNGFTIKAGFSDLDDPKDIETILREVQAFMFWKAGVAAPPKSIGKTAIAAFSSGNFILNNWLKDPAKRKSNFFSKIVSAVYFLDPLRNAVIDGKSVDVLNEFIRSANDWATENPPDKRVRVYMQWTWPSLQNLIVDKPLGTAPYFVDASEGRRTVAVVTSQAWTKALQAAGWRPPIDWTVIHHAIAGTMLTHALSPHGPAGRDV